MYMAVLKSSALGQIRKSIGATNYYRRSGVQISRNKPVFAPGRKFTPAQLDQQWRMQVVQAALLECGLGKCSNCTNVVNSKLYNASSRYNRMVKSMLLGDWNVTRNDGFTPLEACLEYSNEIFNNWSIGDVKGVPSSITITRQGSLGLLEVKGIGTIVSELLRLANKRRRPSGQLGLESIGICGMIEYSKGADYKLIPILPTWQINPASSPDDSFIFNNDPFFAYDSAVSLNGSFVIFCADGYDSGIEKVDIQALHCTSSFPWGAIPWGAPASEDDRPVIE